MAAQPRSGCVAAEPRQRPPCVASTRTARGRRYRRRMVGRVGGERHRVFRARLAVAKDVAWRAADGATVGACFRYRVTGLAAEAAFFAILSLPPLIFGLAGSISYIVRKVDPDQIETFATRMIDLSEQGADRGVGQQDRRARRSTGCSRASGSTSSRSASCLSLWSGSRALNVFVDTITIMYGLGGRRGIVRTRMLSFSLYVVGLVVGVIVLPLVLAGPAPGRQVPARALSTSSTASTGRRDRAEHRVPHHAVPPVGARCARSGGTTPPAPILAFLMWVIGSYLLRSTLSTATTSIYGPLAAPIAVLLWLYLTALAVLIGAAVERRVRPDLAGDLDRRARVWRCLAAACAADRRAREQPTRHRRHLRFSARPRTANPINRGARSARRGLPFARDRPPHRSWPASAGTTPGARRPPHTRSGEPGPGLRVDRGACTAVTDGRPGPGDLGRLAARAPSPLTRSPLPARATGAWCALARRPAHRRAAARRGVPPWCGPRLGKSSRGQVFAANVDVIAVVVGLHPEPNLARVERLLAVAWGSGAQPGRHA